MSGRAPARPEPFAKARDSRSGLRYGRGMINASPAYRYWFYGLPKPPAEVGTLV